MRFMVLVWMATVAAVIAFVGSVFAGHGSSEHSDNMKLIASYDEDGAYRNGTDMAFWGDVALLGNLDQGTGPNASPPGGFRIMDISEPSRPRKVGQFTCLGDQSDVSIWDDLVIVSVDKPTTELCDSGAANWEGIRIVSIADPSKPRILKTVATDCGSHTNTIYPDVANRRLLVYVLSYPLAGRYNPPGATPTCSAATHRKFSVVEVPLDAPEQAKVLATPSVETNIGCHDVTLFLERRMGAAACLTESQLWDLSNPAEPKVISRIPNPNGMNLSHSTAFTLDGRRLVIGDELGGAAASPGCVSEDQRFVSGGLFFFDIADAASPRLLGTYKLPRSVASEFCTAHLFNVVPLRSGRDVLVTSWYTGATSVIDFTDPAKPTEIAHYIPRETTSPDEQPTEAAAWASYWYNGAVFANNFDEDVNSISPRSRGLDVFTVDHPAVADAVRLDRLNPQVQEPLPPVVSTPGSDAVVLLPPSAAPSQPQQCRKSRRVAVRLRAPGRARLRTVTVFVNGRRVQARRFRKGRRTARIVVQRLPRGTARLDVTAVLRSGRRIERTHTYKICG